jgi:hypothetical protein
MCSMSCSIALPQPSWKPMASCLRRLSSSLWLEVLEVPVELIEPALPERPRQVEGLRQLGHGRCPTAQALEDPLRVGSATLPGGNAKLACVAVVKTSGVPAGKPRGNSSLRGGIAPGATHAQGSEQGRRPAPPKPKTASDGAGHRRDGRSKTRSSGRST